MPKQLKPKEIKAMNKEEREKKLTELEMELIKSKTSSGDKGLKTKEIKRAIARILTLNK